MYWVNVNENTVDVVGSDVIVQNNVNAVQVKFSFSEEWDNLKEMVVFRGSGKAISIRPIDGLVTIPWECCKTINDVIYVGAYGIDDNGMIVRPTTWGQIGRVVDGVDVDVVVSPTPNDNTFSEIIGAIGDLKDDIDDMSTRVSDMSENLSDFEGDLETYSYHQNLHGLEEPDQHPIEAVIGLKEKLVTTNYLTPDELRILLGGDSGG